MPTRVVSEKSEPIRVELHDGILRIRASMDGNLF
jgi:hypothetical protein